eukprot:2742637-Amphidinium_carterae.1
MVFGIDEDDTYRGACRAPPALRKAHCGSQTVLTKGLTSGAEFGITSFLREDVDRHIMQRNPPYIVLLQPLDVLHAVSTALHGLRCLLICGESDMAREEEAEGQPGHESLECQMLHSSSGT